MSVAPQATRRQGAATGTIDRTEVTRSRESATPAAKATGEHEVADGAARAAGEQQAADPSIWVARASQTFDRVTLRMQERLAERRAVERRVLWRRWGIRAAIALGVVAVVWAVMMSPLLRFDASAVEVSGAGRYVDGDAVEAAIAAQDGDSLLLVDTGALVESLEEIRGVASASVVRLWPTTLRVEIESRVPVAAVPRDGGGYVIVDDEAQTVSTVKNAPKRLPIVTVPLGEGSDRVLQAVLGVIDELPVDLRSQVESIEAETEDSVSFTLRDGPRVEWGSVEDSATKAQVLSVLLDSDKASSAEVIDVSAPSLPITRDE
ncbi:cell division protein FtsQ/DivIB [Demequina sp. NBRC 110054]|uniref:cell division protein FtsQ/DivIB n=1 Tax=Demequina sp. NBRC 110054 TaxID=1570343 RepID=UPI001177DE2B|nr:FtsQ-type POTRA domain-containing protein [Demequina sp. NBRC 110054]